MIDISKFRKGVHDGLDKHAGFRADASAVWNGAKNATQGGSLAHPVQLAHNAWEGGKAGFMNEQTKDLQTDGLAFRKDQFGKPQGIDFGQTVNNYGRKFVGALPQQFQAPAAHAGQWINENKNPLMVGGAALAGGYMLHKLLTPPQAQYSRPVPYTYPTSMQVPQSLDKYSSVIDSAIEMPFNVANYMGPAQPPQTHTLNVHAQDPRVKQLLENPQMREYLSKLITQPQI